MTDDRACGPHVVVDRLIPGGRIMTPTINIVPPARAREYKLYRRINNGDLSLIAQGQAENIFTDLEDFSFADYALPNAPMYTICYFIQVFDEHGNASALVPISECIEFIREYPAPLLIQPELYSSSNGASMARLTWYCQSAGVEQFEVWIASDTGAAVGSVGADLEELAFFGARHIQSDTRTYNVYQTRRLSSVFGQSAPEYSVEIELDPNQIYSVVVRAVSSGGFDSRATGPFSNVQSVAWSFGGPAVGPNVAWPDRDLPGLLGQNLDQIFNGPFGMEIIRDNVNGPLPALRVGQFTLIDEELDEAISYDKDVEPIAGFTPFLMPDADPVLFTSHRVVERVEGGSEVTRSIFPFALYRYRMDAPLHRVRTDHVEQVTPLMREIAYESDVFYDIGKVSADFITVSRVRDPYFRSQEITPYDSSGPTHNLYMLDHSPVQYGGTYQYLIVFFTDRGEIETVLPLNQITIQ